MSKYFSININSNVHKITGFFPLFCEISILVVLILDLANIWFGVCLYVIYLFFLRKYLSFFYLAFILIYTSFSVRETAYFFNVFVKMIPYYMKFISFLSTYKSISFIFKFYWNDSTIYFFPVQLYIILCFFTQVRQQVFI